MNPSPAVHITELSPESFARFARFITSELGIKMPESKMSMVQSRLLRRIRELGFDSVERYGEYFFQSADAAEERIHLINAITTNKTDFFREPAHFDYLVDTVLPQYHEGRLKVWSAGCSSGEEPYTLAMVLSEYGRRSRGFDFSILATDVSTRVLEWAQTGIYDESAIDAIPAAFRREYLLRSKNSGQTQVRIVPGLRRKVSFHRLNFMDAEYGIRDMFDIVFFRNVMIYFDRSTQEAVINKMCRHLVPGGFLFVGHSESLAGLDIPVMPVRASILRKAATR
jgi:chemotaxis protein methyltransferase CheR